MRQDSLRKFYKNKDKDSKRWQNICATFYLKIFSLILLKSQNIMDCTSQIISSKAFFYTMTLLLELKDIQSYHKLVFDIEGFLGG